MKIRDHLPLIVKTMKDSTGKFKSVEAFAEHLVDRVEQAEELLQMYGGALIVGGTKPDESVTTASVPRKMAPVQDISERIRAEQTGGLRENFSKEEIRSYLDTSLPSDIDVQPNGFEKPLKLFRFLENAPGDLNFVRVKYLPQGSEMGAETVVSGTEPSLDADKVMQEIISAANSVLSPRPRRVEARFSTPPASSLEGFKLSAEEEKRSGIVADTDDRSNGAEVNEWMQTVKESTNNPNSLGSQWRSQRGQ